MNEVKTSVFGCLLLALMCLVSVPPVAAGGAVTVTDVAGRQVTVNTPVERFVISEGRYIPLLALLRPEDPVRGVVGMMTTLGWTQPALERQLYERFPEARSIPLFGTTGSDSVSVEKIIDLRPELAIFGIGDHGPGAANAELIRQLESSGTQVVFIDFRTDPLNNTLPSIELLGRLLGEEEAASRYSQFHRRHWNAVKDRVGSIKSKPRVFVQVHPGRRECCWGMAEGMLGPFVGLAGGINIADAVAPGPTAQHTAEYLLVENPDVWIGTASGTVEEYRAGKDPVAIGPGMTQKTARDSLLRYLSQPEFQALDAVASGRAHSFWHNFYNSPFNVVVYQAFAKWLHPDQFQDIDPQTTLEEIFRDFLPFDIDGTYFVKLGNE